MGRGPIRARAIGPVAAAVLIAVLAAGSARAASVFTIDAGLSRVDGAITNAVTVDLGFDNGERLSLTRQIDFAVSGSPGGTVEADTGFPGFSGDITLNDVSVTATGDGAGQGTFRFDLSPVCGSFFCRGIDVDVDFGIDVDAISLSLANPPEGPLALSPATNGPGPFTFSGMPEVTLAADLGIDVTGGLVDGSDPFLEALGIDARIEGTGAVAGTGELARLAGPPDTRGRLTLAFGAGTASGSGSGAWTPSSGVCVDSFFLCSRRLSELQVTRTTTLSVTDATLVGVSGEALAVPEPALAGLVLMAAAAGLAAGRRARA